MSREVEVVISHLELERPDALPGPARELPADVRVEREEPARAAEVAQAMYREVGGGYHWVDRAGWTLDRWRAEVDRPGVEVWTGRIGGETIGYFQLHVDPVSVEIKYFGLAPRFTGRGLGGPLLVAAVRRALATGRDRVTLNTCTLDHPAALPNYLARGFRVVRTERVRRMLDS